MPVSVAKAERENENTTAKTRSKESNRFFIDITGSTMCRNAGNNNRSGNQQRDWHKNQLLTLKQVFFLIIDECFKFFY